MGTVKLKLPISTLTQPTKLGSHRYFCQSSNLLPQIRRTQKFIRRVIAREAQESPLNMVKAIRVHDLGGPEVCSLSLNLLYSVTDKFEAFSEVGGL